MLNLTDCMVISPFCQKGRIVNTLSSGQNFFSSHKHVIGIGPFGIFGIWHGVKWSDSQGKFVQDVKNNAHRLGETHPE